MRSIALILAFLTLCLELEKRLSSVVQLRQARTKVRKEYILQLSFPPTMPTYSTELKNENRTEFL